MAITLDTIVNKVFKVVKNGYDNNEVESFLDEILEEMENREAETNKLKEQVAQLTAELNQTKAELHKAQTAATAQPVAAPVAPAAPVRTAQEDRHSSESFELVLSKAKGLTRKSSPQRIPARRKSSTRPIRMLPRFVLMRRPRLLI